MHIGKRIKWLVDKSGLKQKDVAAALGEKGISVQQLQNIFNKENIDTKHLIQLCKILDVPLIEFFVDGSSAEYINLLSTIEKQQEEIRNLKRKIYVIESTTYSIKNFYESIFNIDPSLLSEIRSKQILNDLESLIRAALDAIIYYDRDPDKLQEYYELLRKVVYLEKLVEKISNSINPKLTDNNPG